MKIFFIQTASLIDQVVKKDINFLRSLSYEEILSKYCKFGFFSLFGLDRNNLFETNDDILIFSNVANSKYIQTKWAKENSFEYNEKNWLNEILAAQIEYFQPDVVYTGNYILFDKKVKRYLPKAKLYALWNASPMQKNINLSHFDVGLSFNSVYLDILLDKGINNVEKNTFYIDPNIKNRLKAMNFTKDIDISFVGRYAPMFKDRNQFLYDVYSTFKNKYNVKYYLLTHKRFRGLFPVIPWKLLRAYKKPVFLEEMFKVYARSKIILNSHSNITGEHKGNMRVFEVLGSGSFMLSDHGVYPPYLEEGKDYVTYKNNHDMIDKIEYFLKNDKEREEIGNNGHAKVAKHYSTETGTKNLKKIFAKYL
jgi:glycosyltransferase involved in cell wall biosynthesis